jgi:hypothetical protein
MAYLRLVKLKGDLKVLVGTKNGQNFSKKTFLAQFQLWSSFDLSSSRCYCCSFSFLQITLWCKIGFCRAGDNIAKTLPTYFLYP